MKNLVSAITVVVAVSAAIAGNTSLWSNMPVPVGSCNTMMQEKSLTPKIQSRPYKQLTEKQLKLLCENVQKVRLGDDRLKVEALLGKPWSDQLVAHKKTNKPIGRFVTYYATRYDKNLVNERFDKLVKFVFDTNDHLKQIQSNVPGIPSRP